ncbi:MAG TPA: trans-2-enoyl-CoA reductase family protein [Rectinema sp.]|nr:trans-2-enoyl-CoA reductase family protein [Treponema sp.]OQC75082.1 MAG: putative reductase [Spirochaetes bacterium ADurb.Bin001]HNP92733.1 trans-2-enoyl-CoA reductase family protein [Rectinema sp.]HNT59244.1 trans-2-enoyl-CoA reductase family protein [Rectinema sp.]HNV35944.1 trans-2-enoyl-CoA reductase family protein [Rectinema sp.]
MIIKPMIRNNICLNAHPEGCRKEVRLQAARVMNFRERLSKSSINDSSAKPNHALIIGCSTGYGLASRLVAAFGYGAETVGFSYEKEPSATKPATPGWYANKEFDRLAQEKGLFAASFSQIDAFSHTAKQKAIEIALENKFKYDLVIYSLASSVRVDPDTGVLYRSVIKPIGRQYAGRTIDIFTEKFSEASVQPATEEEITQTIKVMGGEDWQLWIDALKKKDLLAPEALTLAYSYIGPPFSWPIYRDGTIGQAKLHLEETAKLLEKNYGKDNGLRSFVSINKAVVTRASAVIPIIPLYISTLFKVMKERNIHEDCLDQMMRLFSERLYQKRGTGIPTDEEGRIRIDDLEMGPSVQNEISSRLARIDESNLHELADVKGFRSDFLRAHGFDVPGVDYERDIVSFE